MRGRPKLDIGTYGKIRTRPMGDRWQAIAGYRHADGITRQHARVGNTKAAAERALKRCFATEANRAKSSEGITVHTRMSDLATEFFSRLRRRVEDGERSPNTLRLYEWAWDTHLAPAVGGLTVAEATVPVLDALLQELRTRYGADSCQKARAVLSGMLGIAVRHQAIAANPIRDVEGIPSGPRNKVRALEPAEAVDLWQKLTALVEADDVAVNPAIPDLVLWMLGTSDRLGQALAVHWPWVDLDQAVGTLGPTVIRVKGEGLRLNWGTSKSRDRVLDLPAPVLAMLLLRQQGDVYRVAPMGPVFPGPSGDLWDPTNASWNLRRALDAVGYDWVTSHVFRKTVATILDDAGLSARHVADQLGHARPSMTQDVYMARKARNPQAKAALEAALAVKPARRVVPLDGG